MWSSERQARAVPIRLTTDPHQRDQHVPEWPREGRIAGGTGRLRDRGPRSSAGRQTRLSAGGVAQINRRQAATTH